MGTARKSRGGCGASGTREIKEVVKGERGRASTCRNKFKTCKGGGGKSQTGLQDGILGVRARGQAFTLGMLPLMGRGKQKKLCSGGGRRLYLTGHKSFREASTRKRESNGN